MKTDDTSTGPLLITEKEMFKVIFGYVPSCSTVARLRKRNQLPPPIQVGGRWYYRRSSVHEWISSKEAA
jgi:predicted DNA-binding transcriptional regulator AlpA